MEFACMHKHGRHLSGICALVLLFLLTACSSLPQDAAGQQRLGAAERISFNQKVFDKAWSLVDSQFYDPGFNGKDWKLLGDKYRPAALAAQNTDALYAVLNRMLGELEVSHLSATRTAVLKNGLRSAAIGLQVIVLENNFAVFSVVPASPAALAGIQKGWLIKERDGLALSPATPTDFRSTLGVPVTYTFLDNADHSHTLQLIPVDLDLNPRIQELDPIEMRELADGRLYLRVDNFNNSQVMKSMRLKLGAHPDASGLILDLRGNPGGRIDRLRLVLGHFFTEDVEIGSLVTRNSKEKENESWSWRSAEFKAPIIVLTDGRTASAAEIFSHVMQHHRRGTIVGHKTAGAVLATRIYKLPDGGFINIPGQDYIGLDGQRLEGRGVTPDIKGRTPTLAEFRAGIDPVLELAMQELRKAVNSGLASTRTVP